VTAVPALGEFPIEEKGVQGRPSLLFPNLSVPKDLVQPTLRSVVRLRSFLRDPSLEKAGSTQLAVTALLVIPVWIALAAAALSLNLAHGGPSRTSTIILSMLAGELALGAAVVSSIRAWVAREIAPLLAAIGLSAYALGSLAESASTSIGSGSAARWVSSGSLSLALGFLFLSVVSRAETGHPWHHRLAWLYPVALVALGIGALSEQNLLLALAWVLTGLTAILAGRRDQEPLKIWLGVTMICLAQGALAGSILPSAGLAQLGSHVLRVVATTLMLLGTIRVLQESVADHKSLVLDSLLALRGSEARRQSEEDAHQEAVHSLRSALGAITVASHALVFSGKSDALSHDDRVQLSRALEGALERAKRLVAREWASMQSTFPLIDLVMPAVVRDRSSGLAIDVDIQPDAVVQGDRARAAEVLETILDNARRYAPGSPLTIHGVRDHVSVILAIADRGPGIPPDSLERVFERGWTTSNDGNGAGIGLHIARLLMEEQGGTLSAANRAGGGAIFVAEFRPAPPPGNDRLKSDSYVRQPEVDGQLLSSTQSA
jgi:signal transduction histidine kinase